MEVSDQFLEVHQWIILAHKLLNYKYIKGCLEICNHTEIMILKIDKENSTKQEYFFYLEQLKKIKRKLNIIMVKKIHQKSKKFS